MNVYISADIEGVAGLVAGVQATSDHREYERFRRIMTGEVNAAIEGVAAAGGRRIVVNDSHGQMINILIEELDQRAELISGSPKPFAMMEGIGEEFDAALFIGYHAASGTGRAVLEHTTNGTLHHLTLNGIAVGEIGLNAFLAARFGVPVVLVAGDRAAVEEARRLVPGVEGVVTKEGITRSSALCRHPLAVKSDIREAAGRAVATGRGRPALSLPDGPLALEMTFQRASQADVAELVPGSTRSGGRSVVWSGTDMKEIYRAYRACLSLAATV